MLVGIAVKLLSAGRRGGNVRESAVSGEAGKVLQVMQQAVATRRRTQQRNLDLGRTRVGAGLRSRLEPQ